MKITQLIENLNKNLGTNYEAKKLHNDKHYIWFIIYYDNRPDMIVKYHKEAKYFCYVLSLDGGVNPIHAEQIYRSEK